MSFDLAAVLLVEYRIYMRAWLEIDVLTFDHDDCRDMLLA